MSKKENKRASFIERAGKKIPDPVIIFAFLFAVTMILTIFMGGMSFETLSGDGTTISYEVKNMFKAENFRWILNNALVTNWLAYGGGVLGTSCNAWSWSCRGVRTFSNFYKESRIKSI